MMKNNSIITTGFILLLIIIRVLFRASDNIPSIIYFINCLGLLYVLSQIMLNVYNKLVDNSRKKNKIIARRNKSVKNKLTIGFVSALIICICTYFIVLCFGEKEAFNVVNDIVALISLCISIEDDKINELLYRCSKRSQ